MSTRTDNGFRTGPIEAIAGMESDRGAAVLVKVLDTEVWVMATPGGRRVSVHVRHGLQAVATVDQTLYSSAQQGTVPVLPDDPDTLCRCGHERHWHYGTTGVHRMPCHKQVAVGAYDTKRCYCKNFHAKEAS